jgi:AmpD protein
MTIDLVVIHGISLPPGEFGGPWIDALFTNNLDTQAHEFFCQLVGVRVSSHLLIRRDGAITQYVPFHRRAWHAGQSIYLDRSQCNDFSIGIELEGTDTIPYTDSQYHQLGAVLKVLRQIYPKVKNVVGHADIAPGRKTDPGPAFHWERLQQLLV